MNYLGALGKRLLFYVLILGIVVGYVFGPSNPTLLTVLRVAVFVGGLGVIAYGGLLFLDIGGLATGRAARRQAALANSSRWQRRYTARSTPLRFRLSGVSLILLGLIVIGFAVFLIGAQGISVTAVVWFVVLAVLALLSRLAIIFGGLLARLG